MVAMVASSRSWTPSVPGVNFCATMPSKRLAGLRLEKRPEPARKLDEVVAEDAEERPGVEMSAGEPCPGAARRLGDVLVAGAGRGAQRQRLEPAVGMVDLAGILPDRLPAARGDERAAKVRARWRTVL